jgi:DcmR-like sensory protein
VLGHKPENHSVMFPSGDAELARTAADFLAAAVRKGGAAIVVATASHRQLIEERLIEAGLDLAAVTYVALDAEQTMRSFILNDWADAASFYRVMSPVLKKAGRRRRPVRVYGEMVSLLWEAGLFGTAIEVEALWNELGRQFRFELLCAYPEPKGTVRDDELALLVGEHARVIGPGRSSHDAISA